MYSLKSCAIAASLAALFGSSGASLGQAFPSKPIHILAAGAGGSGDIAARLVGQGLRDLPRRGREFALGIGDLRFALR